MNDVPQIRQGYRFMCETSERNNQQLLFRSETLITFNKNGVRENGSAAMRL